MNPAVLQAAPVIIQQGEIIRKRILYGFLFLLILILGIIVTIKVVRALKKAPNAKYVPGGGAIPEGWIAKPVTDSIFNVIDGVFTLTNTKDEAYAKFNDLNDNQMIAVYNDWLAQDYDQKGFPKHGTLTKALKDENTYNMMGGVNNMDLMISNLERLHLT